MMAQVAPLVFVDDTFALKGGTAINLFVRDMPREQALARINEAIREGAERLVRRGFQVHIPEAEAGETKLLGCDEALRARRHHARHPPSIRRLSGLWQ
jgi:hypothetical protein